MPKKKHANLVPVVRLLTAPLRFGPPCPGQVLEQLLHTLLAVPALPTSLPLASLTHLSANLPLFTTLLPLGAAHPELLIAGRLSTEEGKTYFLANLVTFGITGGMLARHGVNGASSWIKVVGVLLAGTKEGWGRWADGQIEPEPEEVMPLAKAVDSDDDEENVPMPGPSRPTKSRNTRWPLASGIQKKVILLAAPAHLSTLVETLLTPSAPSHILTDFCAFALSLLNAFRGSPKWEAILEVCMSGSRGKALEKRIWREGVRGKWGNSGVPAGWDQFTESEPVPDRAASRIELTVRPVDALFAAAHASVQSLSAHHTRRRVFRHGQ
jgi:ubiquitin-protein ligase E3 C